ncbi:MAG: carboxypeptidase-like regulatory domain-containing protein, partial [Longimicrobiales bacterium]
MPRLAYAIPLALTLFGPLTRSDSVVGLQRQDSSRQARRADGSPLLRIAQLDVEAVTLENALNELHRRSGVNLLFSPSQVPTTLVSCRCLQHTVENALKQLLAGTSMRFQAVEDEVVIVPARVGTMPPKPAAGGTGDTTTWSSRVLVQRPKELAGMGARSLGTVRPLTGSVSGIVTNKTTAQPMPGTQVNLVNTRYGGLTDQNGRFSLTNVPPGTYSLSAQFLGFSTGRQTITVAGGAVTVRDIELSEAVLSLQELVVTGVSDPTVGLNLPFTVARLNQDQMQMPVTGSPLGHIQGKVAGAAVILGSGKPGDEISIMLRSPTAIETSNMPLIVVDGVIVARAEGGICATCDIDALDIASIEVIKGAAASSLYGSRAAAGVVSIMTNRGRTTPAGQYRITSRTEFGADQIGRQIPLSRSHQFRLTADGTAFADAAGNPVGYQQRTTPAIAIADQPYPGTHFDNVAAVYQPGRFLSQNMSFGQNGANSNILFSVNRLDQRGALANNDGYQRNTGRVSFDQR